MAVKQKRNSNSDENKVRALAQLRDERNRLAKELLELKAKSAYLGRSIPGKFALERKLERVTKLIRQIKHSKNPRKLSLADFKREVKSYPYGMPGDQLTAEHKEVLKKFRSHFENDKGYIKVRAVRAKNASRENFKGTYNSYHITGTKDGKRVECNILAQTASEALHHANTKVDQFGSKRSKWTHAELLEKGIRLNSRGERKRNSSDGKAEFNAFKKERLNELSQMFQGEATGKRVKVLTSDLMPSGMSRLGHLVLMKVKPNGLRGKVVDITFDGNAFLAMDLRKNLWPVGTDARIENPKDLGIKTSKNGLALVGDLVQIDYVTAKKHIENGKLVRFWHPLGEVNKEYPKLYLDADNFPVIVGGGYDVWDVGIVN